MVIETNLPKQDKLQPEDLIRECTFGGEEFRAIDTSKLSPKVAGAVKNWFDADGKLSVVVGRLGRKYLGEEELSEERRRLEERKRKAFPVIKEALGFGPEEVRSLLDE